MSSFSRRIKEAIKWINKINPYWAVLFSVALFVLNNFLSNNIPTDSSNVFLATVKIAPNIINAALWLVLMAVQFTSANQIDPRQVEELRRERFFSDIFSGSIKIKEGKIEILKPLEQYKFMIWPNLEGNIKEISRINTIAFGRSIHADTLENKIERNISFWQRNPYTFLQMNAFDLKHPLQSTETMLFFSSVLPINDFGFNGYFLDRLAYDTDFPCDWIAKPNEKAHSILVFTIASDVKKAKEIIDKPMLKWYLYSLAFHIEKIHEIHFQGKEVMVYFQNSDHKFKKLADLAGFQKTELRSKDEQIAYVTKLLRNPDSDFNH